MCTINSIRRCFYICELAFKVVGCFVFIIVALFYFMLSGMVMQFMNPTLVQNGVEYMCITHSIDVPNVFNEYCSLAINECKPTVSKKFADILLNETSTTNQEEILYLAPITNSKFDNISQVMYQASLLNCAFQKRKYVNDACTFVIVQQTIPSFKNPEATFPDINYWTINLNITSFLNKDYQVVNTTYMPSIYANSEVTPKEWILFVHVWIQRNAFNTVCDIYNSSFQVQEELSTTKTSASEEVVEETEIETEIETTIEQEKQIDSQVKTEL